jgi:hypothetical protein
MNKNSAITSVFVWIIRRHVLSIFKLKNCNTNHDYCYKTFGTNTVQKAWLNHTTGVIIIFSMLTDIPAFIKKEDV